MRTDVITPVQITSQLSQVLKAEAFQNSSVLSHFLKFIVEETLAGHQNELKEYTIAVKVLLKRPNFNPQTDAIVRIHAGRLRRALLKYYENEGKNDPVFISIPKGSYVPDFSVRINSTEKPLSLNEQEHFARKKITVAVLPFSNISTESTAVAFADGLGDHISTELTRYPELSVVSYYSCRNIMNKATDIKEIALMLDANYILTGTVQILSNHVHVTVQLILGETRECLWADSYDRQSTAAGLFDIQYEIVRQVVSKTAGNYGAITRNLSKIPPQKNIDDLKIYDAVFWYYHFVNEVSEDIFYKAEATMQKAVETDPGYALGWAVLGEIFVGGYFLGFKSRLAEQQLQQAVVYAKKAIKLDPTCQHAYQTLAVANVFLRNKTEALKAIDEWAKIKPGDAGIMGAMGCFLIFCAEYEHGFKMLDESVNLNPYYQWWFNAAIGFYYFQKEAFEDALYWTEKINMPNIAWELLLKAATLAEMNYMHEAKQCCILINQRFPYVKDILEEYTAAFLQDKLLVERINNALLKAGIKEV